MPSRPIKQKRPTVPLSEQHARRIAEGRTESQPTDYKRATVEQERLAAVRRAIEDKQVMRELGLL